MMASAGGGGGYAIQHSLNTTDSNLYCMVWGPGVTLLYDDDNRLYSSFLVKYSSNDYNQSAHRIMVAQMDTDGTELLSKSIYGQTRTQDGNNPNFYVGKMQPNIMLDTSGNFYMLCSGSFTSYWAKYNSDLTTRSWEEAVYAGKLNGIGYNQTAGHLYRINGQDGYGASADRVSLSTGAMSGWYRRNHSSVSGIDWQKMLFDNPIARDDYQEWYYVWRSNNNKEMVIANRRANSNSVLWQYRIDDYTDGRTFCIKSTWDRGNSTSTENNVLAVQAQCRRVADLTNPDYGYGLAITELTKGGTFVKNVFIPAKFFDSPRLYLNTGSVARDANGNTYLLSGSSFGYNYDDYHSLLFKLDSSFNISQVIAMHRRNDTTGHRKMGLSYSPCNIAVSPDSANVAFQLIVQDTNSVRSMMTFNVPTDLTSITGTYDMPDQANGLSGANFTIEDVTSEWAGTEIVETPTITYISNGTNQQYTFSPETHSGTYGTYNLVDNMINF